MARPKKLRGYWDARRGLYCDDVVVGYHADGRRRRKRVTAKTREALEPKVRALLNQVDAGLPVVDRSTTVRGWCERYVAEILPYGPAKKSAHDHAGVLARYVYTDRIAGRPLVALTPSDVRGWIRRLEQRDARAKRGGVVVKLSPATVGKARQVLSAALTAAVHDEVVVRNVVRLTSAPEGAHERRTDDALEPAEVDAVLAAARRGIPTYLVGTSTLSGEYRPDRLEALVVLVLALGLRQSEALDLRWADVDLDAATLDVYVGRKRLAKTAASARTIPLPEHVVEALRAHQRAQRVERLAAPVWVDESLVFPSTTGTRIGGRNALRYWHALCERAGVGRRRFHAARHTAAIEMREAGVSLEDISALLGHASIAITADIYARPTVTGLRRAASTIDATYRERRARSAS